MDLGNTFHMSHVMCHMSHVTVRARDLQFSQDFRDIGIG